MHDNIPPRFAVQVAVRAAPGGCVLAAICHHLARRLIIALRSE